MIVAHAEKFWRALAVAVGRPDLLEDPRFKSNAERLAHREALEAELSSAFAADTLTSWSDRLTEAGVLFAPVRNFEEVFADPVVRDGIVQSVRHPTAGDVSVLRNPIKMSANSVDIRLPPPLLGEHTEEVMQTRSTRNDR